MAVVSSDRTWEKRDISTHPKRPYPFIFFSLILGNQKLGALIKRASQTSQVIIATQSVDVINCFSIEDLMVVDREENQTVFKRLEAGKYEEWLQDYSVGEIWKKNIIGGRP